MQTIAASLLAPALKIEKGRIANAANSFNYEEFPFPGKIVADAFNMGVEVHAIERLLNPLYFPERRRNQD